MNEKPSPADSSWAKEMLPRPKQVGALRQDQTFGCSGALDTPK